MEVPQFPLVNQTFNQAFSFSCSFLHVNVVSGVGSTLFPASLSIERADGLKKQGVTVITVGVNINRQSGDSLAISTALLAGVASRPPATFSFPGLKFASRKFKPIMATFFLSKMSPVSKNWNLLQFQSFLKLCASMYSLPTLRMVVCPFKFPEKLQLGYELPCNYTLKNSPCDFVFILKRSRIRFEWCSTNVQNQVSACLIFCVCACYCACSWK